MAIPWLRRVDSPAETRQGLLRCAVTIWAEKHLFLTFQARPAQVVAPETHG